jgi:regulator of cell morphogenesis and NO signaling
MTYPSLYATVGDTVAHDVRSAAIFSRHGIDFCCGGRRSIAEACEKHGVDPERVLDEIRALEATPAEGIDLTAAPVDDIIDRIMRHHAYVRAQTPLIMGYLWKLTGKHGDTRVELPTAVRVFGDLTDELFRHMEKEERILFPYIRAMAERERSGGGLQRMPFGTIRNPIRMMEEEHQGAAADLSFLRTVTHGYVAPPDACNTWRACYAALDEFEQDLHEHVHLENSVLFPAALRMEDRLTAAV